MNRNGHPNVTRPLRDMPIEKDQNTFQIKTHPDKRLKEFAALWLRGPVPDDLMTDLVGIMTNGDYSPEKRVHQIVWQAIKWGMEA